MLLSTTGRPRNLSRELQVLELLASGERVSKVAKIIGVHRNTVYRVRDRVGVATDSKYLTEASKLNEQIEQMRVKQERLRQEQEAALRKITLTKYRHGADKARALLSEASKILLDIGFDGSLSDLQKLVSTLNKEIGNGQKQSTSHSKHKRPAKDAH
jgi:transposase-like protein